jgi:hypothetical protein
LPLGTDPFRHGVIERHPTLGVSRSAFDPGDIAAHGIVAEYDPQISAHRLGEDWAILGAER